VNKQQSISVFFIVVLSIALTAGQASAFIPTQFLLSISAATSSAEANSDVPAVTHHSMTINGETLEYTATADYMPLTSDEGVVQAQMFYIAYVRDGVADRSQRPITFLFNGGPGSSSIWLHMGCAGPKRVVLSEAGAPLPPPPRYEDNPFTWLDITDLVFIDPIGTGYSRTMPNVDIGQYYSMDGDVQSVAEFIRLYITENDRWLSPKFVAGESYGGIRGAALARLMQGEIGTDTSVILNGLVFLSPAFDYAPLMATQSNNFPYALSVPTYFTTALYHNKISIVDPEQLPGILAELERWVIADYLPALFRGDSLPQGERGEIASTLSAYTGLSESYILSKNLRVGVDDFREELLGDEQLFLALTDARYVFGWEFDTGAMQYADVIQPTFAAALNDYMINDLGYRTDRVYVVLSIEADERWQFGDPLMGFPNVLAELSEVMKMNPFLKVLVGRGYYDLDVPYYGTEYCLRQLQLSPDLTANITREYYESGHMVYTDNQALEKFKADVARFMANAIP
jgi:carboxypeptidase C (cathepsin A)